MKPRENQSSSLRFLSDQPLVTVAIASAMAAYVMDCALILKAGTFGRSHVRALFSYGSLSEWLDALCRELVEVQSCC